MPDGSKISLGEYVVAVELAGDTSTIVPGRVVRLWVAGPLNAIKLVTVKYANGVEQIFKSDRYRFAKSNQKEHDRSGEATWTWADLDDGTHHVEPTSLKL